MEAKACVLHSEKDLRIDRMDGDGSHAGDFLEVLKIDRGILAVEAVGMDHWGVGGLASAFHEQHHKCQTEEKDA